MVLIHAFSFRLVSGPDHICLKSGTNGIVTEIPESVPLTYATRGMEPLRGFPEFLRAAAFAQEQSGLACCCGWR